MNDVRQRLRDYAVDEPPDHLDLDAIMRAGSGRRRRRRVVTLGAGSLAVASIVALSATIPARITNDAPPAGGGDGGAVMSLSDARLAVEGSDYRVLATRSTEQSSAESILGISDDGLGVVVRQDGSEEDALSVGLIDPADGGTTWLPGGPQTIGERVLVGADTHRLVFRRSLWSDKEPEILVYDRAAQTWSTMQWPTLPRAQAYYLTLHDNRLYMSLSITARSPSMELWSVSLTDDSDVRDEHAQVYRGFDITGDQLVWSDGSQGVSARLRIRDLASGQEHSIDPGVSAGCRIDTLERVGERLLLGQVCDERDSRLQVVTMAGERVVTIDEGEAASNIGANIGDGGRVAVIAGGEGGPYVLDPVTTELWRIGAPASLWEMQQPVPDGSDLTQWTTSDWVPSIDGDPDGEGPNEPTADDDVTNTQHLITWMH